MDDSRDWLEQDCTHFADEVGCDALVEKTVYED
jgi:hypothetical protein